MKQTFSALLLGLLLLGVDMRGMLAQDNADQTFSHYMYLPIVQGNSAIQTDMLGTGEGQPEADPKSTQTKIGAEAHVGEAEEIDIDTSVDDLIESNFVFLPIVEGNSLELTKSDVSTANAANCQVDGGGFFGYYATIYVDPEFSSTALAYWRNDVLDIEFSFSDGEGSSTGEAFRISYPNSYYMDWGDGNTTEVPSQECRQYYADGSLAVIATYRPFLTDEHTYASSGIYVVKQMARVNPAHPDASITPDFVVVSTTVTIQAPPIRYVLSVEKAGNGSVTSTPAGISCGADCSEEYNNGEAVTLNATADANWIFTGWSGACTNSVGSCVVTMDAAKSVAAIFISSGSAFCAPGNTLSGPTWVQQFPDSASTADLKEPFRSQTEQFLSALRAAGASVHIETTYRPIERAYLMHYSFLIAKNRIDPRKVPARNGVKICWAHTRADGSFNASASKTAAKQMVAAYRIVFEPSLTTNHAKGLAIDMVISWSGALNIKSANGTTVNIRSNTRSGMNKTLWTIGASYGVKKFQSKDFPHWSFDGH